MVKILFSIGFIIAACFGVSAQISIENGNPLLLEDKSSENKSKSTLALPITKDRLIQVLSVKTFKETDIIPIIKHNGVNFTSDRQTESELSNAGASANLISVVKENYRAQIGVANGKATNLVTPKYPPEAAATKVTGTVNVMVLIDEEGNVIDAKAVSGDPVLKDAAVEAALASKFQPFKISGKKVKVTGNILYNFTR